MKVCFALNRPVSFDSVTSASLKKKPFWNISLCRVSCPVLLSLQKSQIVTSEPDTFTSVFPKRWPSRRMVFTSCWIVVV